MQESGEAGGYKSLFSVFSETNGRQALRRRIEEHGRRKGKGEVPQMDFSTNVLFWKE